MSVANFGPTLRSVTATNAFGAIAVAAVAPGNPLTTTNLIRTAGGVEIPLVLAPGAYAIKVRATINANNAGSTIIFGQPLVIDSATGGTLCAGQLIAGCAYADGSNTVFNFEFDSIILLAAQTSIVLRYKTTGSTQIQTFNAGTSMRALSLN